MRGGLTSSQRTWMIALAVGAGAVASGYVVYDVLVVTDQEQLEAFAEDVSGPLTEARVDGARARWIDLSRQTVEIAALGEATTFALGEQEALTSYANTSLRRRYGTTLRVITSGVRVDGDEGSVAMRLVSREQGMAEVAWTLARHGDGWLVARLDVRPITQAGLLGATGLR